ncbi:MAG: MFS transporter [Candidatus Njordarchaeales archaeon]
MIEDWKKLPIGAKRLITYYSISTIPLVGDIFLPIYLYTRGWELIEVGFLLSFGFIMEIVGSFVIGYLFDKGFQPKIAMFIIDFASGIIHIIYAIAGEPELIYLGYSLWGFLAPLTVAYQTIEKEVYPETSYEAAFSLHMALPNATQLIGIIAYGYFLTYIAPRLTGFRIFYFSTASLYFITSIYILARIPRTKERTVVSGLTISRISKDLLPFFVAEILIIFGYQIAPQFIYMNYVFNIAGFNIFMISLTLILANIAGVVGGAITSEKAGRRELLFPAIMVSASSYALMYLAKFFHKILQVFVFSCLHVFVSYLAHTVWFVYHRSLLYERVPQEHKGKIFGTLSSMRNLIFAITPIVSAQIATLIDPLSNFLIAAIIILIAAVPYIFVIRTAKNES